MTERRSDGRVRAKKGGGKGEGKKGVWDEEEKGGARKEGAGDSGVPASVRRRVGGEFMWRKRLHVAFAPAREAIKIEG